MTREGILEIFMREPDARSPYGLYGYPPMWRIGNRGDVQVMARPGRTQTKVNHTWTEVDGIHWQEMRGGEWVGQGMQATWEYFLEKIAPTINQHEDQPDFQV